MQKGSVKRPSVGSRPLAFGLWPSAFGLCVASNKKPKSEGRSSKAKAQRPKPRHFNPYNLTAFSLNTIRASSSALSRVISPSFIIPVSAIDNAVLAVEFESQATSGQSTGHVRLYLTFARTSNLPPTVFVAERNANQPAAPYTRIQIPLQRDANCARVCLHE